MRVTAARRFSRFTQALGGHWEVLFDAVVTFL
jgi:hypothetical protein